MSGVAYPADLDVDEPLTVLVAFDGTLQMEKATHSLLRESRVIGEWYHMDERIIQWLNDQLPGLISPDAARSLQSGCTPTTWPMSIPRLREDGSPDPKSSAGYSLKRLRPDAKTTGGNPTGQKVQFQIRVNDDLWHRFRALAARTPELSQSSHARIALSEYLTREEQK
jgi:hypothetical protein